jgi:hypothetical protein
MRTKAKKTKEQVYDTEINPLMAQIIAICKKHKIPVVASFGLESEEDEDLHCSTVLVEEEFNPSEMLLRMARVNHGERPAILTVRDGSGNVVESHAIL